MALNAELSAEEIQSFGGKDESPDHFWKSTSLGLLSSTSLSLPLHPTNGTGYQHWYVLAVASHDMALCEAAAVLLSHDIIYLSQ